MVGRECLYKEFLTGGQLHREEGPAVIALYANKYSWYLNNELIKEEPIL